MEFCVRLVVGFVWNWIGLLGGGLVCGLCVWFVTVRRVLFDLDLDLLWFTLL